MARIPSVETTPFLPAEPEVAGQATTFRCALCGGAFTHGALVCGSCPLQAGCEIVKCPHCGYQFPRTSRTIVWLDRLLRRAGVRR